MRPLSFALAFFASAPALAQDSGALAIEAKLLFKIATYDANLPANVVRLGVVFPAGDKEAGPEAVRVFKSLESMHVNGRTIEIVPLELRGADELASLIAGKQLYGLFVVSSTPVTVLSSIRQLAKERHLFTFGGDPSWVEKGLTAGVTSEGGGRKIVVNITAATEQDRKFDGAFLSACAVIH